MHETTSVNAQVFKPVCPKLQIVRTNKSEIGSVWTHLPWTWQRLEPPKLNLEIRRSWTTTKEQKTRMFHAQSIPWNDNQMNHWQQMLWKNKKATSKITTKNYPSDPAHGTWNTSIRGKPTATNFSIQDTWKIWSDSKTTGCGSAVKNFYDVHGQSEHLPTRLCLSAVSSCYADTSVHPVYHRFGISNSNRQCSKYFKPWPRPRPTFCTPAMKLKQYK